MWEYKKMENLQIMFLNGEVGLKLYLPYNDSTQLLNANLFSGTNDQLVPNPKFYTQILKFTNKLKHKIILPTFFILSSFPMITYYCTNWHT